MKVEMRNGGSQVPLSTIRLGSCFTYERELYMVISPSQGEPAGLYVPCVCLSTGLSWLVEGSEYVSRELCKVVSVNARRETLPLRTQATAGAYFMLPLRMHKSGVDVAECKYTVNGNDVELEVSLESQVVFTQ